MKRYIKSSEITPAYMRDWTEICEAFAKRVGGELLFVNSDSCGIEFPDGSLRHLYADEMKDYLGLDYNGDVYDDAPNGLPFEL